MLCVAIFAGWQVSAQTIGQDIWKKPGAAAPFQGVGDIVGSAKFYWGFRAYNAADKGNPLANICNSTGGIDVLCVDFSSDATTGYMNVTTIGGVACTTNCTVKTLYDRIGTNCNGPAGCDQSNPTVATRPVLVPSCLNGFACMSCNGSQLLFTAGALQPVTAVAQPLTVSFVAERTSGTGFSDVISSDAGGSVQSGFSNSANNALLFAGSVISVTGVNDNTIHAAQMAYNAASSTYNIDGATATVSPGSGSFPGGSINMTICVTSFGSPSNQLTGNFFEVGVWGSQFSAGQQTSMNSNQHAAYGGF